MAPRSVFLSSGSPTRSVPSRRLRAATKGSAMDSCTRRREPAQHTSPWLKKMPLTTPSTAWSSGASSKTMLAALPPSSSVRCLPVPGQGALQVLADLGRAREGDLVDPRVRHEGRPGDRACAGEDVDDPGRQVGLLDDLGEQKGAERGRRGGLEDTGVPRRQGRGELPRRHHQGEVPGDDLAGDAERGGTGPESGVLELVGPARVVEEMGGGERHVDVARLADRLAVVHGSPGRRARGSAPG